MRILTFAKSKKSSCNFIDTAEDVALASRVAAIFTGVFMYFFAPVGIFALFAHPPLIVVIGPAIIAFASIAYVFYALAKLYDKKKEKKS